MGIRKFTLPRKLVIFILNHADIENFVEIGAKHDGSLEWVKEYFNNVYTGKGSFSEISTEIQGKSLFFLNNDWSKSESLKQELERITTLENPLIFINKAYRFSGPSDDAREWISWKEIIDLLAKLFPGHYITIMDEMLICVPEDLKKLLAAYWTDTLEERLYIPEPAPVKRSLAERIISRAKRVLRKKKPLKVETVAYDIKNSAWFENQCNIFYNSHKWLQEQGFKSIIDIGANVGQFGKKIRQFYPEAKLYSFEPIPLVFKELEFNFKNDNNFTGFNVGLGDKEGKLEFYMNEFSDSSSMLKMGELHKTNFPYTKNEKKILVDVKKLDSCLDADSLEKPYLLKLDVQGFEEQVINGGLEVVKNADMIITEASYKELYEGQSLFDSLYEILKGYGFQYIGNLDQMNSAFNGEPLQGDAIFQKIK